MWIFAGQRKDSCVSRVRQEVWDRQHAQQSHQASPQVGLRDCSIWNYPFIL
jgi:hypothetical protein